MEFQKTCERDARLRALRAWCRTPAGAQLADAEQSVLAELLGDVFGYHLVVMDPVCVPRALDESRILHRVVQGHGLDGRAPRPSVLACPEALPWRGDSIDAFVLPHVLELSPDPHQVLREIDRCLVGEGHLIVTGFYPWGLWGLRRLLLGWRGAMPWALRFIGPARLGDWLSLLGFDVLRTIWLVPGRAPCYSRAGPRALLAAAYVLVARKRVLAMTPLRPRWRPRRAMLPGVVEPTRRGATQRGRG